MKGQLFIVILNYIVSLEKIDAYREKHLHFLDDYYQQKIFIASGPQIPRNGGIILARGISRQNLENILKEDPFSIHELAEYHIYEFSPTKYSPPFQTMLDQLVA